MRAEPHPAPPELHASYDPETLDELEAWIDHEPLLRPLLDHLRAAPEVGDAAHDLGHVLRVTLWTLRIGNGVVEPAEAAAAALLHDLVDVPKNHPDRARASELAAEAARPLLERAGFEPEAVDRIAEAITDHSFSRGAVPRSPLGCALQDADRLESLGVIGIMRTAGTAQRMGSRFFDDRDPFARHRALDDRQFAVDHFYSKLLLLPGLMRTERGRLEADRRAERLRRFALDLADELGVEPPEG